ncbi:MAG: hypothetical protein ACREN8_02610 [Candidatus Dormibacteraceae bacterium]
MNPLWMWLRGHPAERLVLIIVVLAGLGLIWQLATNHLPHPKSQMASPTPAPPGSTGTAINPTPSAVSATPSTSDTASAASAVGSFLIALNSYHYDDTPSSLGDRVRPLVTPQLYATQFAQPSVPYGKHPELHEIDTPTVLSTIAEGYGSSGELGFLAKVQIEAKGDKLTSTTTSSYELFLTSGSSGWKIDSYTSNG